MTGTGLLVFLITTGLAHFHFVVPDDQVATFVNSTLHYGSELLMFIGQVRRKDLVAGIYRKATR